MKNSTGLRFLKLVVMFGVPFLSLLYAYQFTGQERAEVVPFRSFRAPDILVLNPVDKQKISLPFRESITVVNFWATWCPPCVSEFPAMMELQRQLEGKGVELVFISVDDSWEKVLKFQEDNVIDVKDGRQFWDPSKEASEKFGSLKFPETYVIRKDGWVVEKIIGEQRWTRPVVVKYFEKLAESVGQELATVDFFPRAYAQSNLIHEDDKKTLDTLKNNIETATKSLMSAEAALKAEQRSYQELKAKERKQEQELSLHEAQNVTLEKKKNEIDRALLKNKTAYSNEVSGRSSVAAGIKATQSKITRLEKELELERIKLVETQKLLSTRNQNIESLEKAKDALMEDLEKIQARAGAAEGISKEKEDSLEGTRKEIRAREKMVSRLESNVRKMEKEVDKQKAKLVEFEELLNK